MRIGLALIVAFCLGCSGDYIVPNHVPGVVKVASNNLFVAYGEGGLLISDINTDQVITHLFPPRQMRGIDDFDMDGNLLFVLDAREQDYLAVYSIEDVSNPELVDGPIKVEGGPFNGISARSGNLVVSGGSRYLEYMQYNSGGKLRGSGIFQRDRGHPDVLLSDNGQVAFASTDFTQRVNNSRFGMLALALGTEVGIPTIISQHPIPEAGFSQGLTSPVGFPIQADQHGDYLLVTHGGGLTVIELVNRAGFGTSQLFDLGIEALSVIAENDIAYITGYNSMGPVLLKVDITDVFDPMVMETVNLNIGNSIPTSIALSDQFVFIAAGEAGLIELMK